MKKKLIFLIITLFVVLIAKGQNFFLIGEQSYPCSETMTLKSNSEKVGDLNIVLAKDGNNGLFAVSVESYFEATFSNKIIIYLQDGTVIKSDERETNDFVDSRAKAIYSLTVDQLNKMQNSNIHSVRYTLEVESDYNKLLTGEGNWSASNEGIQTKTIITDFLEGNIRNTVEYGGEEEADRKVREEEQRTTNEINSRSQGAFASTGNGSGGKSKGEGKSQGQTFPGGNQGVPTGDPNSNNYGQGGSGSGSQGSGLSFSLSGRSATSLPKPNYPGDGEGIVVVKITVDKNGNVTAAEPGVRGTTIMNQKFWQEAKQAAIKAKFNTDNNAPKYQQGTVSYRFVLD